MTQISPKIIITERNTLSDLSKHAKLANIINLGFSSRYSRRSSNSSTIFEYLIKDYNSNREGQLCRVFRTAFSGVDHGALSGSV